ncbi:MAG: 50S ribosomal protein L18 [bacterium]
MLEQKRKQRQRRIRARLKGTAERPRASVFRGNSSVSVQLIDDVKGHTLLTVRGAGGKGGKIKKAGEVGKKAGKKAIEMGVKKVVFDRGGYAYHGRVKAVAEGIREAGIKL